MEDGLFGRSDTVLDFGCGRGQDVARLSQGGFRASGWDPHFSPDGPKAISDLVFLTYVLNVIDDPAERRAVLAEAWSLARSVLVVSTRLTWEKSRVNGDRWADGLVTSRKTFQKLYQPDELRAFVEEATGVRCVAASAGTVYAFKNDTDRLGYLARRVAPDYVWSDATETSEALASIVKFAESRGRAPTFDEIPAEQQALLDGVSETKLRQIIKRSVSATLLADGARRTTLNTLLVLGMEVFSGRAKFSELPLAVRQDIRSHFPSYRDACRRADRLLLKLRDKQYIRGAMRNSPGKVTPSALYVHRRAVPSMPVVLRLYEYCGSVAVGRPPGWTVLKLHHDRDMVSWLDYPEFDSDPHPKLALSYAVDLKSLVASHTSYAERQNRPLLHRKHEFLTAGDKEYAKYERLTTAEVRAGLYANPSIIGTEVGWAGELDRCGVELRGHRLVKKR